MHWRKKTYVESRYLSMSRVTFQTIGDWDLGHCISACSWQIILGAIHKQCRLKNGVSDPLHCRLGIFPPFPPPLY